MKLAAVTLYRLHLPHVAPLRSAHGVETVREALLVHVAGPDTEGWGECVAMSEPTYSSEHVDGAHAVLARWLVPALLDAGDVSGAAVAERLAFVSGHRMAKAALEMAVLDAELRAAGQPLARYLGAARDFVDVGVAVGLAPSVPDLISTIEGYVAAGYRRVKMKIAPGWDIEPVGAVRAHFGDGLALQVDANGAYRADTAEELVALDQFELALVEQPLPAEDLLGHAALAQRLRTPLCLDESITSIDSAALALHVGACSIINVKAGRVGGLLEAVRIHDYCKARGVALWCGGMMETGVGRAAALALAALPGFTLPADLSASDRYYAPDITEPFVLDDGRLRVPDRAGIGVVPEPDLLTEMTVSRQTIRYGDR